MCNGPIRKSFELDPELRRAEGATEVFHVGKTKGIAGVGKEDLLILCRSNVDPHVSIQLLSFHPTYADLFRQLLQQLLHFQHRNSESEPNIGPLESKRFELINKWVDSP